HFDSNFFHTVHHLLFKPGFLSKEYLKGRRGSYLHPIRMYVFTSALFFLLFFKFAIPSKMSHSNLDDGIKSEDRATAIKILQEKISKDPDDTASIRFLARVKD